MEYRILAITPPKNSDACITAIQNSIFREHGFASALALPVFLPLLFMDPAWNINELIGSLTLPQASFPVVCGDIVGEGCAIYLHADPEGRIRDVAASVAARIVPEKATPGFIPVCSGLFLSCNETNVSLDAIRESVHTEERVSFSSFSLAIADITVRTSGPSWWNDVSWEIVWEKRLPKGQ